jgi:uncharacterized protein YjbI with pentapeptide repeats
VADEKQLAILRQGPDAWNKWRKKQPSGRADVEADLSRANLRWANLRWANLSGADLREADLREADLRGANLSWADLRGANLRGANLRGANLRGANLREANLREANLREANLSRANLRGADLRGADLREADPSEANLREADPSEANLRGADLLEADLREADLRGANLSGADLSGADLSEVRVGYTIFADVDLSAVKSLEGIRHMDPSSIGIDSIYKSKGQIPEIFLRDAGVPEPFMLQMKALVEAMEPIQFYSCFISYSSKDQDFAERLHADLRANNVRCWFAPEDLKIGDRFQERIEESIRLYDKVMIVLSEASVKSRWVEREVNAAREREDREDRTILFPVRIDETIMEAPQPWAADIRRGRHIGSFSDWQQHPSYKKAFDRLLRDLKAST